MAPVDQPDLASAVLAALEGLPVKPQDAGAVKLAQSYAETIDLDPPSQLAKLGPLLLSVLESLGMTPRARAALVPKGGASGEPTAKSEMDEYRERRRAARKHGS